MLEDSIRTVLIPAWQQARRSGNRGGSVACTEQGRGSGITRSEPFVSVSYIRSRVCFLEDETQWEMTEFRCHTVINVALRPVIEDRMLSSIILAGRHTPNDGANGVESRPKYDESSLSCNCGIASAGVVDWLHSPAWRRSSHITQGWPVMGSAADHRSIDQIGGEYKTSAMMAESSSSKGKGNSFLFLVQFARKEDC